MRKIENNRRSQSSFSLISSLTTQEASEDTTEIENESAYHRWTSKKVTGYFLHNTFFIISNTCKYNEDILYYIHN